MASTRFFVVLLLRIALAHQQMLHQQALPNHQVALSPRQPNVEGVVASDGSISMTEGKDHGSASRASGQKHMVRKSQRALMSRRAASGQELGTDSLEQASHYWVRRPEAKEMETLEKVLDDSAIVDTKAGRSGQAAEEKDLKKRIEEHVKTGEDLAKVFENKKTQDTILHAINEFESNETSVEDAAAKGKLVTVDLLSDVLNGGKDPEDAEEDKMKSSDAASVVEDGKQDERWAGTLWPCGKNGKIDAIRFCFRAGTAEASKNAFRLGWTHVTQKVSCLPAFKEVQWTGSACSGGKGAIIVQSNQAGCWSGMGYPGGGNRELNLQSPGCDSMATAAHEILHALGVNHEQTRSDRSKHVQILWQNMQKGREHNFDMDRNADTSVRYDLGSIMHYPSWAFSTNGQNTIKSVEGKENLMGQRTGLSTSDIAQLKKMYCDCKAPSFTPCFDRETSSAYTAASPSGTWKVKQMYELRAGDYVLAADASTGDPFVDRVLTNLHLQDPTWYPMLEIHHTLGVIKVTPDHVLLVGGEYKAARFTEPGDSMVAIAAKDAEQGRSAVSNVTVLSVAHTSGRIVNPLTHSGLILVATGGGGGSGVGLLVTTLVESRENSMLAMARHPGLGKVASYLFPAAFQDSHLMEFAILVFTPTIALLPPWISLGVFAVVDAIVGLGFIAWNSWAVLAVGGGLRVGIYCSRPLRFGRRCPDVL